MKTTINPVAIKLFSSIVLSMFTLVSVMSVVS